MRSILLSVAVVVVAFLLGRVAAQDVEASCDMCPSTYISADEIRRYADLGRETGATDQQVRSIDIGKSNVQFAVAHREALDEPRPNSVASHDLVGGTHYIVVAIRRGVKRRNGGVHTAIWLESL